nr:phospholipase domain-containing protein [Nonomuraea sediminis]
MTNSGAESVRLTLFPYGGEFEFPRHFDVLGGTSVTVTAPEYDLVLTGPNGFRRGLRGSSGDFVAVRGCIMAEPRAVALEIENLTGHIVHVRIAGDPLNVHPDRPETVMIRCEDAHGWYDVSITCPEDPHFLRRLMGHIENGAPSISG